MLILSFIVFTNMPLLPVTALDKAPIISFVDFCSDLPINLPISNLDPLQSDLSILPAE